jgi:hypothetical protein
MSVVSFEILIVRVETLTARGSTVSVLAPPRERLPSSATSEIRFPETID